MKDWFIKHSIEFFSLIVLVFITVNMLFMPETSYVQKLTLAFAIMAILHEFEEKRFPGGFFELMAKKFGMDIKTTNVDLAGFFVICYWTVLIVSAYVFDHVVIFLIMSVALGIFEAFVHTMGIWIHKMKKPYTPGLLTAWLMAALSFYTIYYLNTNGLATGIDYLIGSVLMVLGFMVLQRGVFYAAHMTYKDVRNNMKKMLSSK